MAYTPLNFSHRKKKSAERPRLQEHLHSPGLREGGLADFPRQLMGKSQGVFRVFKSEIL